VNVVLTYKIKHDWDIEELLKAYKRILQRAIDKIWENIEWKEKKVRHKQGEWEYETKRLLSRIPSSNEFKRDIRNELMEGWEFAKHYVDSAVKTAYSIINSWEKNYKKGKRGRNKPIVKREFIRVKTTLMKIEDGKIRITIEPKEKYLELDYSNQWFYDRIKDWKVGELIIKKNEVFLTFSKDIEIKSEIKIGVDANMMSLDIFHPEKGWIKIDLSYLHHISEVYDEKIDRLKSIKKKSPKRVKKLLKRYYQRRSHRIEDYLNKLAVQLSREFPNTTFIFEDLNKHKMFKNHSNGYNRKLSRATWGKIIQKLSYRVPIKFVNPAYTSSSCPICGKKLKSRNGQVECVCGFKGNRQFVGAFNVWRRGHGVALSGDNTNDLLSNEPRGELRLMHPKSIMSVNLNGRYLLAYTT